MNEYIKHIKDDKYRIAEEKRAAFKKLMAFQATVFRPF